MLDEAVDRIANEELGYLVIIRAKLGVYEHLYQSSEFQDVSEHYVPIKYVVELKKDSFETDPQHSSLKVFLPPYSGFHECLQTYLDDYVS